MIVATYVVLFLLFGSVVLPLKAVVMNLLSITASFGALTWVFVQGHLSGVLGFTPAPIDPVLPVILFCVLFGLSMDYEVFMLTRIHEEYRAIGDTRRAVARGLERSGRLVTGAAVIMIAVVASFGVADSVILKIVGLGSTRHPRRRDHRPRADRAVVDVHHGTGQLVGSAPAAGGSAPSGPARGA